MSVEATWFVALIIISLLFQLFKGTFYHCDGPDVHDIKNKDGLPEQRRPLPVDQQEVQLWQPRTGRNGTERKGTGTGASLGFIR